MKEKLSVEFFRGLPILVMGDLMLDTFCVGKVNRQSPEFDIPVLDFDQQFYSLGGAANVSRNIKSLKGRPITLGFNGNDAANKRILEIFEDYGMERTYLKTSVDRITTEKIRFFNDKQPLLRMDKETKIPMGKDEIKKLERNLRLIFKREPISFAILQDYNKGFFTKESIDLITYFLRTHKIPFAVDPKKDNFWDWFNPTIFKPNLKEISEALGYNVLPNKRELDKSARIIFEKIYAENILITLGENGIYYNDRKKSGIIPANKFNIQDVSGAGDTVISTAAMAYCCNFNLEQIAYLSNLAAGLVCQLPYVQPLPLDELSNCLSNIRH
jgi:rfaE bifunctional protein kinase chain/domain